MDVTRVSLTGGPNPADIVLRLDGEVFYARSVTIEAEAGDSLPRVFIEPDLVTLDTEIDTPNVFITEDAAALLKKLGWTPPNGD